VIVFDLKCTHAHVFEAWFGSSADYDEQQARGLVSCPICGDGAVEKAVMAPRVAAKGNRQPEATPQAVKAALAMMAKAQAEALQGSEWVGTAFADRARAMHLGEEDKAVIHGQATVEQARALIDEGVEVAPLPLPIAPPEARN
jgi:hypothetical protein